MENNWELSEYNVNISIHFQKGVAFFDESYLQWNVHKTVLFNASDLLNTIIYVLKNVSRCLN